jgi:DHA2 family multidrug resistance protein-like MFS transporter
LAGAELAAGLAFGALWSGTIVPAIAHAAVRSLAPPPLRPLNGYVVCSYAAQILAYLLLPFLFQVVMHRSAAATGLLVTPWPLAVVVAAPIAGRLSDRYPSAYAAQLLTGWVVDVGAADFAGSDQSAAGIRNVIDAFHGVLQNIYHPR